MCGRYTLRHSVDQIAARFDADANQLSIDARHNIAPTQPVTVVTVNSPRRLQQMEWGLVPFWAKDKSIGNKMINARAETLLEKPAYKYAVSRRRCLVPSDGFYEWKRLGEKKQPMHIHRKDGGLFAFAGLWEEWKDKESGEALKTCTIITVEPNALMADIHNRMPAILRPEFEDAWLDHSQSVDVALACLLPYPTEDMEAYAVSRAVNSPAHDSPDCLLPEALAL